MSSAKRYIWMMKDEHYDGHWNDDWEMGFNRIEEFYSALSIKF